MVKVIKKLSEKIRDIRRVDRIAELAGDALKGKN